MTLTTDKASRTTFILTRFKTGYSTQEVDAFMQEFIAALRSWETGTPYGVLTSRDVTSRAFTLTRFHDGYEQGEVDAFVREAAATLQAWETGTITEPPDDGREAPGYGSAPAGTAQPAGVAQPIGMAQPINAPAGVLTSQEVMNAKFSQATFEGYEQDGVDELLNRVITTLQAWDPDSAQPAGTSQAALTSHDVLNTKFSIAKFFGGYEQDEIDEFLDEVTETLRAWEKRTAADPSQPAAPGMLTSGDVLNKKFSVGKFFGGYEQDEVNELLDTITRVLQDYESRSGR